MTSILFVDDQPSRYESLLNRLVPSAIAQSDAHLVGNVRDALERLRREQFDVLVVDMLLPESPWSQPTPDGGAKLLEFLEEDEDIRRPKYIVGITGAVDQEQATKPFNSRPWVLLQTAGGGNPWEQRLEALIRHVLSLEDEESETSFLTDVCVLTALRTPEFDGLMKAGWNLPDVCPVDSVSYAHRGELMSAGRSLSVVASCCLRMGSVESALLAAKLIEKFRPRILALAGICAGYEDKVQYGDVIVASPTWDYMSRKIAQGEKGATVVTNSPDYIDVDRAVASRFELMSQDSAMLQAIHAQWGGEKVRWAPRLHIGPSATGPAVVADERILRDIRSTQHRATIGLEMEAYGVYSAARMAARPRPLFFSAKAVCDYGTMLKEDKYQSYASFVSAATILGFLKRFGAELVDLVDR
ncbi:hypothetical protein RHDC3_03085 [Rhodocyclaceae bacterium]|nr:hypothetical protein RHDC3_03085 [Rhodocyclaceae bacterium]